jgi:hypothetical protein
MKCLENNRNNVTNGFTEIKTVYMVFLDPRITITPLNLNTQYINQINNKYFMIKCKMKLYLIFYQYNSYNTKWSCNFENCSIKILTKLL